MTNLFYCLVTVFVHLLYYDYEQINSKPDLRMIKLNGAVAATSIGVQSSKVQNEKSSSQVSQLKDMKKPAQ